MKLFDGKWSGERTGTMSREEMDYQKAYEEEHLRNADLAGRVADLEAQVDDLNFKLNRIKCNPVWKASAPARRCKRFQRYAQGLRPRCSGLLCA